MPRNMSTAVATYCIQQSNVSLGTPTTVISYDYSIFVRSRKNISSVVFFRLLPGGRWDRSLTWTTLFYNPNASRYALSCCIGYVKLRCFFGIYICTAHFWLLAHGTTKHPMEASVSFTLYLLGSSFCCILLIFSAAFVRLSFLLSMTKKNVFSEKGVTA